MKFVIDPAMPAEVRRMSLPLVKGHAQIAPSWLKTMTVTWDPRDGECIAYICVRNEYRDACITICPHFIGCSADERVATLRHEFAHLYTTPIKTVAVDSLKNIVGADYPTPGSRVAECEIDRVHEAMTEDLATLFEKLGA